MNKHIQQVLHHLDEEIKEVEAEIIANNDLKENYELAVTVKGAGPVITTDLRIKTGSFATIDTAKKASSFACLCPFPNSSGKMVGKAKTSPFADNDLKSLLYMGAKSAVKYNTEYRLYYEKKKMEGKPHFLILTNVANKMLRTIYSVVKSKELYSQGYICLDPREVNNNNNSSTKKVA